MNKLQKKWIKALRSGKYKQGRNYLRTNKNEFCCFGVLCDISEDNAEWRFRPQHSAYSIVIEYPTQKLNFASMSMPPLELTKEVGLKPSEVNQIVKMNDSGASFEGISNKLMEWFNAAE